MDTFVNRLKFSESGVRGVVGEGLTPHLATRLAAAFGMYVGRGRVVLGRDTRTTGPMFELAVAAGLRAVGCEVVHLGVVPTPTIQLNVLSREAAGGIAITASHNPMDWNALKFVGPRGVFLDPQAAGELFDIYSQGEFDFRLEGDIREEKYVRNAFHSHKMRIFERINLAAIRKQHFRVAVDCVNGVGALFSRAFLEELGCEVFALNDVADGCFARSPEPLPEFLGDLCDVVRKNRCAIGFAQDPDGDRLTLVTDRGEALSPQMTVALAVEHILEGEPGTVVVNLQTTGIVEQIANSYGCELEYAKVGEINVVEKMIECDSNIGGEGNCGGVIWRKLHPGRDSFAAMAILLELLALSGESLSGIVDTLPQSFSRSAKFPLSPVRARDVIAAVAARYAERNPITFDGLRINFDSAWVLLRASNTEPVLRLYVESHSDRETETLFNTFSRQLKEYIG